jgi:hypothetical protein
MKALLALLAFVLLVVIQGNAQNSEKPAIDKADKVDKAIDRCVKETMDNRGTFEKAASNISGMEKTQRDISEKNCREEHSRSVMDNKESGFIDKYSNGANNNNKSWDRDRK